MSQFESPSENVTPQNVKTVWEYNGSSFEFDIGDADFLEHYEEVMYRLEDAEKALKKDGTASERVRAYDKMFRDFYDDMFGEGAGDAILGDKRNVTNCDNAFVAFIEFAEAQGNAITAHREAVTSRYSGNRAQRRNAVYRRG